MVSRKGYVVPAIVSLDNIELFPLDEHAEINIVKKYFERKKIRIRTITPFYYPFYIGEVSDEKYIVIDPYSRNIYRFKYRIPVLDKIKIYIEQYDIEREDFLVFLNKIRDSTKKIMDENNLLNRGIVLEKIIIDKEFLNMLPSLIKRGEPRELNGIVLDPDNGVDIVNRNISIIKRFFEELDKTLIDIDSIWNTLINLRSSWEIYLRKMKEIERFKADRSCQAMKNVIDQRIIYLHKRYGHEMNRVVDVLKYRSSELRKKKIMIDQAIERMKIRVRRSRGEERNRYREILANLYDRRRDIEEEFRRLEEDGKKRLDELKTRYMELIGIEDRRKRFFEREAEELMREYARKRQRVDELLSLINSDLDRVREYIISYRNKIHELMIHTYIDTMFNKIFFKGYIVVGSKGIIVVPPSYISSYRIDKPLINSFKSFKKIFKENRIYDLLTKMDLRTIYKYDIFKK